MVKISRQDQKIPQMGSRTNQSKVSSCRTEIGQMKPILTFSFPSKEANVHIRYLTYHLYGKPHAKLVQMGQESST